jgi:heme-degrading monooxygenase HmoA
MVVERADLAVTPGREAEFEAQFVAAGALLRGAKGCHSVSLARGIESPSTYQLLLEWDSVAAHTAFTQTEEFAKFRAIAGPFFAGKPQMEHFAPVMKL